MKTTLWLVCGSLLGCGLHAQQATNALTPPAIETPAAASAMTGGAPTGTADSAKPPAPAPKKKAPAKKAAVKKPSSVTLKTTPLHAGAATVIASNVNVRGQATLRGEVVGRLTKGQEVTVLEEVTLKESAPDEPSAWAKIQLPPGTKVWVHTMFIDADSKKVKPRRLNVRGGPGENYSVLGLLERDQTVNDHQVKGDWLEIDPPPTAYAFVAAQYLSQELTTTVAAATPETPRPEQPATTAAPETAPATEPAQPAPTTNAVPEAPVIAAAPTEAPPVTPSSEPVPTVPSTTPTSDTNLIAAVETEADEEEPLPPRIVQREGVVRGSASIQAPTKFELFSPESRRVINYLYIDEKDLDLGRYKGLRIIATGEEGLDERWRNTPVLNIQRIQVLE